MADNKQKLMIIDGHSLAFRAFYGVPVDRFVNADGQHTNAVHGFVQMMLTMLEKYRPDNLAIAFDVSRHSFRTEEYPEYKGTRGATPPEFKGQVPLLKQLLASMGIKTLEKEGFEADDLIATLATKGAAAGQNVFVVSGDRDTIQLVTDEVTLLYPASQGVREMKEYDPPAVVEKYGVRPEQYPDIAALVGETSDNLPGVPKVGPKTAAKWIQQYGSLSEILAHKDEIGGVVGQSLRDNAHLAERNRRLNQLVRDVELETDINDLTLSITTGPEFDEVCDVLGFRTVRARVKKFAVAENNAGVVAATTNADSSISATVNQVSALSAAQALYGSGDTATAAPAVAQMQAEFLGAAEIAPWLEKHENPVVVLEELPEEPGFLTVYLAKGNECAYFQWQLGKQEFLKFKNWLASKSPKTLWSARLLTERLPDLKVGGVVSELSLLAQVIRPDKQHPTLSASLKALAEINEVIDPLLPERAAPLTGFSRARALATLQAQEETLLAGKQGYIYREIELPLVPVIAAMRERGVTVDHDLLEAQKQGLDAEIETLQAQANEIVGEEVKLSSPQQLQRILFDVLQLPPTRKIRTGYSTDAESLESLVAHDISGFVQVLLKHRENAKLRQIIQTLQDEIHADGRIHTRLLQLGAATGRFASDQPNLQNIPIRSKAGNQIRAAFKAGSEYEALLTADYSQIEMRVMAHLCGDSELIAAFNDGEDLHRSVGARVFGVQAADVTPEMRAKVKAMSYGLAYGLGAFGLAKQLGISNAEAKQLMEDYFKRFGAVREYLQSVVAEAEERGYTETLFGRRRPFPDLQSPNRILRTAAERAALNAPIQGTSADIIKIAMLNIENRITKEKLQSRMVLQIHDELMFECAAGEREQLELLVREEMAKAADLKVPLEVSVGYGADWQAAGH